MPLDLILLRKPLFELRELVVPSPGAADLYDVHSPGLLSGYAAAIATQCWRSGELPLWAPTQDGGMEQIAWRPGRFIDWPDTTADVAIAELPEQRSYPDDDERGRGSLSPPARVHLHHRSRRRAATGFRTG